MIASLLFLLASSTGDREIVPLVRVTLQECPAPTFDREHGDIGDRAIVSDDGSHVLVQCGDGIIRSWKIGTAEFQKLGAMPLFDAAKAQGIVPASMRCPMPSILGNTASTAADCDILDHDDARQTYVLRNVETSFSFLVAGPKVLRESTVWQRFGAILPDKKTKIAFVDSQQLPELLQSLTIGGDATTLLAPLPNPNLLVEDGEGRATAVVYSRAHDTIIVSFAGQFRVAEEMTYLRAFKPDGVESWNIAGRLPSRAGAQIIGDSMKVLLLASGRLALAAKKSAQPFCEIIDIQDGHRVFTMRGWPVATSRDGNIALIKGEDGALSVMQLTMPAPR